MKKYWPLLILVMISTLYAQADSHVSEDKDYAVEKDLTYRSGNLDSYQKERCKLDLYRPVKKKKFATVIWFHGGGLNRYDQASGIIHHYPDESDQPKAYHCGTFANFYLTCNGASTISKCYYFHRAGSHCPLGTSVTGLV